MNYPNMYPEILEAVHLMYEDEPDVEVDCLLYLKSLGDNVVRAIELGNEAENKLEEMNRCVECGTLLKTHEVREPHPEIEGCPDEVFLEAYCPECDMSEGD